MCERFDMKPLFLGKLRPERSTSNQMVSQQRTSFAWRHKQPIYYFRPQWAGAHCSFCNEQPSQSHNKTRQWKSMLIHQGWFTALYTQHLLNLQSLEFEICIFPREAIPSHYFPLREDLSRVLAWGLHG